MIRSINYTLFTNLGKLRVTEESFNEVMDSRITHTIVEDEPDICHLSIWYYEQNEHLIGVIHKWY